MPALPKLGIFERNRCPVCHERRLRPGMRLCPICGTVVRFLGDTHIPRGRDWWVFLPPACRYKYMGWTHMSHLGYKMQFGEEHLPGMARDTMPRNRADDQDSEHTEKLYEKLGCTGRPV